MSKQACFTNVVIALAVPAAAAAAEEASPPPSLEEVVVTAERRSTNLQTTGISASVLTGADLTNNGIMSVDGLQAIAPSVVIENFGQGNDFNIRGIGKGEHNTQTSTGVITYRDGVPTFPGYNVPSSLTPVQPFREETVTAYETGWKAAFLHDHLRTQVSAFYNNYKHFQVTVSQPDAPTLSLELNDPSTTKIYGVEEETQAAFGDFSFDFGVSVLRSNVSSIISGLRFAGNPRQYGLRVQKTF